MTTATDQSTYLCIDQDDHATVALPGSLLHHIVEEEDFRHPLAYTNIVPLPPVVLDDSPNTYGSALEYSPTGNGPWAAVSYHSYQIEAMRAYADLPHHMDHERTHYRINSSPDLD